MTLAEQLKHEGWREGERKGKLKSKLEIAKRLLAENMELTFISRVTKLPISKIKKLQDQNYLAIL